MRTYGIFNSIFFVPDIIEELADYMVAKVTLKFENFSKTDLVTLIREGNDWKVVKLLNLN